MRCLYGIILSFIGLFGLRPDNLLPLANCELWLGKISGNDSSVEVQLNLCPGEGMELSGVLQWSSTQSGWNRRAIKGAYKDGSKKVALLYDESFIESAPIGGWRFCLIDQYVLSRGNGVLQGPYYSKQCKDRGSLVLQLKK